METVAWGCSVTGPRIDPDRAAYEREKALFEQYQREKLAAERPAASGLAKLARPMASESTGTRATIRNASPADVARNRDADLTALKGTAREFAQGATLGLADEAEAGLRALGPRSYADLKREIGGERDTFRDEHPVLSMGANVAGGLVTGSVAAKAVPGLAALRAPGANLMRAGGRMYDAAAKGAAMGAASGAASANEGERMQGMLAGAAMGGVGGAVVSGGIDAVKGMARLARNTVRGPNAPMLPSTEEAGQRRVLANLSRSNKTPDDLATWNTTADAPDILAEGIGERGIRDVRTARAIGNRAPDRIEEALTDRARGEVGRVKTALRGAIGDPVDDQALIVAKRLEAQTDAAPIYDKAIDGVKVTDPRVLDFIKRPSLAKAYKDAQRMAADDGELMPSIEEIMKRSKPSADELDDVALRGASKTDGMTEEAALGKSTTEMRSYRPRVTADNIGKLSDKDLAVEHAYLSQMQGDDAAKAAIRDSQEYAEYLSLKDVGNHEDARGLVEQMGYDPATFADQVARDAAGAAKRMNDRAPLLERLQKEMERRGVAPEMPADAATSALSHVAGRGAVSLPERGGEVPTLSAKSLQRWKLAMDDQISQLEGMSGGTSTNKYRQAIKLRDELDNLLYEHANQADDGASMWGKAQQTYAKPMQEADAFAEGQRFGRTMQPSDVPRMQQGPHADWRAKGVGNTIHEDLDRLGDGAAGPVRNPAPTVMGSEQARARMTVATRGNLDKQAAVERAASNAARRLRTRQIVTGNSQTAEKFSDIADQQVDPETMARVATSPLSVLGRMAAKKVEGAQRRVLGGDMDAAADILMAGAPGHMSRADAIRLLQTQGPAFLQRFGRQTNRAALGSGLGSNALLQSLNQSGR